MSKGSARRPGTGYAENWDKVFGKKDADIEKLNVTQERIKSILFPADDKVWPKKYEPTPLPKETP